MEFEFFIENTIVHIYNYSGLSPKFFHIHNFK